MSDATAAVAPIADHAPRGLCIRDRARSGQGASTPSDRPGRRR
ncbi:hypothetical protein [Streptomyces resistomycificus]|nr:hypothetical protein [Streptomyces resistomycificus]